MFRLSLFGGFQLQDEHGNPLEIRNRKAQLLLAYLVLHAGQDHSREKLIDLFWPDFELDKADNNLRQTIHTVRKAIEPEGTPRGTYLTARQGVVRFSADSPHWLDARAFEDKLKESEHEHPEIEARARALKEAVALYRGHLLEGTYEDWVLEAQEAFRTQYLQAVKHLIEHYTHQRAYETALAYAQESLNRNPLQEETHRQLMYLYHAMGERAAALQQYEECKRMLTEELGLEPSPETEALREEIESRSASKRMKDLVAQAREMIGRYPELGAPFVGREDEFKLLALAWTQMTKGRGKAVAFTGEPGVGKSRLCQEFLDFAAEQGGFVFRGRSYEIEGKLPYQPLIDGLRRGLEQLEPHVLAEVSPLWISEVARLVPELAEGRADAAPSTSLYAPEQERNRLFESLTQFFRGLARAHPVVVFGDDLQWADTSTLQLLTYLIRHTSADQVLVLSTYRDDELDEAHPLWNPVQQLLRDRLLEQHNLAPLSAQELTAMIQGMLKANGLDALTQRVYDESKGVPFYAEELVKTFMDADAVSLDDQRQWTLEPSKLAEEFVPPTVQALVETRLQRLPASALDLLEHVAVLGHGLRPSWIARALEESESSLTNRLEELEQARYLEIRAGRVDFRHDLTREAVYRRLLPQQRSQLHAKAGEALEPLYRGSDNNGHLLGSLALHFFEGEQWDKALDYNLKAGQRVWATSYAKEEAAYHFRRALKAAERLDNQEGKRRACQGLGEVLSLTDEPDEGLAYNLKAIEGCETPEDCAAIYCAMAVAHHYKRELEKGLSFSQKALNGLGNEAESLVVVRACYLTSNFLNWLKRPEEAVPYCERALNILNKSPDDRWLAIILSQLGFAHSRQGHFKRAVQYLGKAIQVAEKTGDFNSIMQASFTLGFQYYHRSNRGKDLERAEQYFLKALGMVKKMGNLPDDEAALHYWLTVTSIRQGQLRDALHYAECHFGNAQVVKKKRSISKAHAILGCLHDALGNQHEATRHFQAALEFHEQKHRVYTRCIEFNLLLNRLDQAVEWFQKGKSHLEREVLEYFTTLTFTKAGEQFPLRESFKSRLNSLREQSEKGEAGER